MASHQNSSSFFEERQSVTTRVWGISPHSVLTLLLNFKKIIITVVVILLFLRVLYNLFLHPLRNLPGPFIARCSPLWRLVKYFQGTWHDDILDLHRKYGQVVRLSPGEVSFTNQDAIKAIYGHGKHITKVKTPNVTLQSVINAELRGGEILQCIYRPQHDHQLLRNKGQQSAPVPSVARCQRIFYDVDSWHGASDSKRDGSQPQKAW